MDEIEINFIEKAAAALFNGIGRYSVGVACLDKGNYSSHTVGGAAVKRSASVIKLYILLAFLQCREVSDISHREYGLIYDMITLSDNEATNALIDMLGMDKINAVISRYGFSGTRLERKMLDFEAVENGLDNYTSVQDVLKFLKMAYTGEFGKDKSDLIYEIMKEQQNRSKLALLLPAGVSYAGKAGELDPEPDRGGVENDAGIITLSDKVLFITVLISSVREPDRAREAIAKFSKATYDLYNEQGQTFK